MTDVSVKTNAWKFQFQVLKALILRDMMSKYADSRLNYLWALLQQVLIVLAMLLVFTIKNRHTSPSLPTYVFVCTGYPIYFAFLNTWNAVAKACSPGASLLMYPQITVFDVIVSKVLLEAATRTTGFVLIALMLIIVGGMELPANPLDVMMAFFACLLLGVSVGLVFGAITRFFPYFDDIIRPLRRLLIFISGVVMVAGDLPSFVMPYFSWNPVFKCLEIARQSWHPAYRSPLYAPWDVMWCTLFMLALGIALERATRRNASI